MYVELADTGFNKEAKSTSAKGNRLVSEFMKS